MDKLPTKNELQKELIEGLFYAYSREEAINLYDRIAERAVHDKLLELLGHGKGKCDECQFREFCESGNSDYYRCAMQSVYDDYNWYRDNIPERIKAQCPKVEEDI